MKNKPKPTDAEAVALYMDDLDHPLKNGIERIRTIIKNINSTISERIKWNAPSYYYHEDFVTFNLRAKNHIHLVFHHPKIAEIDSPLLEGTYKDRRMMYFKDLQDVEIKRSSLEDIIKNLIGLMDH